MVSAVLSVVLRSDFGAYNAPIYINGRKVGGVSVTL